MNQELGWCQKWQEKKNSRRVRKCLLEQSLLTEVTQNRNGLPREVMNHIIKQMIQANSHLSMQDVDKRIFSFNEKQSYMTPMVHL